MVFSSYVWPPMMRYPLVVWYLAYRRVNVLGASLSAKTGCDVAAGLDQDRVPEETRQRRQEVVLSTGRGGRCCDVATSTARHWRPRWSHRLSTVLHGGHRTRVLG